MNIKKATFDKYASDYDAWFMNNENLLLTEANLVAHCVKDSGRIFSVGCGSGLFESILRADYGIDINEGLEPSDGMAEIARKRGVDVQVTTAEAMDWPTEIYDTVLFNGTPSYITDLKGVVKKAYQALKPGGKIVLIDVPKEGNYGALYNLAMTLGSWEHPLVKDVAPKDPYPIEFVKVANWRTTQEKIAAIQEADFKELSYFQTLTKHPKYSNQEIEQPISGYDCGDYVAICAYKK